MVAPAYPRTLYVRDGQHLAPPSACSTASRVNEYGLEGVRKGEDRKHDTVERLKSERFVQRSFKYAPAYYSVSRSAAASHPVYISPTVSDRCSVSSRLSIPVCTTHTKAAGSSQVSVPCTTADEEARMQKKGLLAPARRTTSRHATYLALLDSDYGRLFEPYDGVDVARLVLERALVDRNPVSRLDRRKRGYPASRSSRVRRMPTGLFLKVAHRRRRRLLTVRQKNRKVKSAEKYGELSP